MNANTILGLGLGAALLLAPSASAQQPPVAPVTPVAPAAVAAPVAIAPLPVPSAAQAPRPARLSTPWESPDDQQAPPAPTPPARTAPPRAAAPVMQTPKGQLVNVRVEFTITDQTGAKPPTKKTMTLTVADRENGRIRTTTEYAKPRGNSFTMGRAPLSVDVMPQIDGGKIRLEFSLEYDLNAERDAGLPADAPGPSTNVSERLSAILDSGVPLIIAQSSDAMTDRTLTVEVKATIVK